MSRWLPTAPRSASCSIATSCAKCDGAKAAISCARNLCGQEPAQLWQFYIQLVEVEAAFKNLKDDLQLRPIYHQLEQRIEAHIFVAFLAYCLHVTLRVRLKPVAPGLTPKAVLDKLQDFEKATTNAQLKEMLNKAVGKVQSHLTKAQDIKDNKIKA